jgi:hypothetical protein
MFCWTESKYTYVKFILLLYWGVTFTEVLTTCHSWIHLLHHSPLSPLPPSWDSFNRSLSIFIHEYIVFPLYSASFTFSLYPPPLTVTNKHKFLWILFFIFNKLNIVQQVLLSGHNLFWSWWRTEVTYVVLTVQLYK